MNQTEPPIQIGHYSVSMTCERRVGELYCYHAITHIKTGETFLQNGYVIHRALRRRDITHPHFDPYRMDPQARMELIALSNSLV
jgi:hypothetical protein